MGTKLYSFGNWLISLEVQQSSAIMPGTPENRLAGIRSAQKSQKHVWPADDSHIKSSLQVMLTAAFSLQMCSKQQEIEAQGRSLAIFAHSQVWLADVQQAEGD